jgi:SAM-dependent methyltransferase
MPHAPDLTDGKALARNRRRARRMAQPALFLQQTVATEVKERLTEVNRSFTSPAVVTPWPEIWQDVLPGAQIVADTEVLALKLGAHDLVVHALSLHWANDLVGQLIQCRRALKPDGLFLGSLFGGQTLAELRAVLAESEAAVRGGLSPRVAPMAEIRDLGALLQRAGFALPVADSQPVTVTYRTAFHLMRDLRAMGEGNAMSERSRQPAPRKLFKDAARRYADAFPAADGRIAARFEVIHLTGWAPDPGQQQPLRPGSATARLADVLETRESGLPKED